MCDITTLRGYHAVSSRAGDMRRMYELLTIEVPIKNKFALNIRSTLKEQLILYIYRNINDMNFGYV